MNYEFHKDGIQPTNGEVFVFGSNLAGYHGGGAARAAAEHFGAQFKVGEGMTGNSYALPTKDFQIRTLPLSDIKQSVERFLKVATDFPNKKFFITRVGCVLAGYEDEQIATMFKGAPSNCNFPEEWKKFL